MASKEYRFDESTHTHSIGGIIVPGITTVLKPLYDFSAVPEHILKASCAYGSAVHKVVELDCLDALDVDSLDESLRPSLTGFGQWLRDFGFSKSDFIVEVPMGDPALKFAGIPDLIVDGKAIIELKTRKVNMLTDPLQTVAQQNLWVKNGGARVKEYAHYVLELRQDETYRCTRVNTKDAWSKFRRLLDYYWIGQEVSAWKRV
jgi:hypothetical protein